MQIQQVSLNSNMLSLGSILGTSGSQNLINSINAKCGGGSFFGTAADPFREGFQKYMTQIIQPIRSLQTSLSSVANKMFKNDIYRSITSVDDLEWIPPKMQMPILYYPPVRKMLEEERIDGFGISAVDLADGDIYEDILKSGRVELTKDTLDKDGTFTVTIIDSTDDPEMTMEDKDAVIETREFLDKFLKDEETRALDPTSYPDLHS